MCLGTLHRSFITTKYAFDRLKGTRQILYTCTLDLPQGKLSNSFLTKLDTVRLIGTVLLLLTAGKELLFC